MILIMSVQFSVHHKWFYLVTVMMSMMCEGAMAAVLPTVTLSTFGTKRGKSVYSFMFSAFGVQALIGGIIVGTLQYKIGYYGFFLICLALTTIAGILTYNFDEETKFDYDKAQANIDKHKHHHSNSSCKDDEFKRVNWVGVEGRQAVTAVIKLRKKITSLTHLKKVVSLRYYFTIIINHI